MILHLKPVKETKRYYLFSDADNTTSIYLRKDRLGDDGIDPLRGIVVTIAEEPSGK